MPRKKRPCIVCGEPTVGTRCRLHNDQRERFLALERTREEDQKLIAMSETMKNIRIAEILGVSRSSLGERLQKAKEREAQRRALDHGGSEVAEMAGTTP